jgi:hypothetical protein
MMKTALLGTVVANSLDLEGSSSFCGCGDCNIDWLDGSSSQK